MNKAKGMSIKMKVIVYGFGQKGKDFVQDLIETNENIELIAVTDSYINISNLKIQYNISFIEPSDIQRNEYDCIIVTPEKYNEEITNILFKQGVKKNKIKSLFDFEKENGKYYCNLCENNIFTWKYIGENYDIFNNSTTYQLCANTYIQIFLLKIPSFSDLCRSKNESDQTEN